MRFLVLFLFLFVAQLSQVVLAEVVRVRLKEEQKQIDISGIGFIVQGHERAITHVAIPHKQNLKITLDVRDRRPVWIVQGLLNGGQTQIIYDRYLLLQGDQLAIGAQALPKKILLAKNEQNKIDLVGVMNLDDYLVGVIASEMPLEWPIETLKAQAVAARSYALSMMKARQRNAFQLESSILDQVYRHIATNEKQSKQLEKVIQAVNETSGIVLTQKNGRILKAFYHADCGGRTASAKSVWSFGYNSGTTSDSWCPMNPRGRWSYSLSSKDILNKIKREYDIDANVSVKELKLIRPMQADRISTVIVALNNDDNISIEANDFRRLIGYQFLKSTMFEVKAKDSQYEFTGLGFGHGVGLCQWGSRYLGQKGYDYKRILQHYYPLANIAKL